MYGSCGDRVPDAAGIFTAKSIHILFIAIPQDYISIHDDESGYSNISVDSLHGYYE